MVARAAERGTGKTNGSRVISNGSLRPAGLILGSKPSSLRLSKTLGNESGTVAVGTCCKKSLATA